MFRQGCAFIRENLQTAKQKFSHYNLTAQSQLSYYTVQAHVYLKLS